MSKPRAILAFSLVLASRAALGGVFPYTVEKTTLPNGLDIVVIETPEFKDVLSFNTMVLAGSGREEEKGKTGLAHLFEHILFRHRYGGKEGGYEDEMDRLGTDNNAWTWFDITYYHPLTFTGNLGKLAELESSRFKGLDFTEKTFKTEAGAVLGEYRKDASRPSEKMTERALDLLYPGRPYGHTTMGYYEDVLDMPNHFEAARRFYDLYYRPNDAVVVVAGDVKARDVLKKIEPLYRDWKAAPVPAVKEAGSLPQKEQRESVSWDAEVAPLSWVAYRMPAFKPGTRGSAAEELLNELLVSPAAPLYKKLRYEKQTASSLGFEEGSQGFESVSPRLLIVSAELYKDKLAQKGPAYFDEVASDIIEGLDRLKSFSKQPGSKELLRTVQSKYRYDFLSGLSSPANIASTFAWYYRFGRDPKVLDKLLESVQALEPEDIDRLAQSAFVAEDRAVLSLSYAPKTEPEAKP